MAETLKLGNGIWGTKDGSLLAYNDENGNYKPLPFDFTRASSATVVNKAGLIETVQSGIPRIDFLGNTNGALLLEPQSTNLITYSEDFTSWSKYNVTATNDLGISPDGTLNAAKLTELSRTSAQYRSGIAVSSASAIHTFSCYVKRISGTRTAYIDLGLITGFFNFDTETMYSAAGVGTFENVGNGWYRIRLSHITASAAACYLGFGNGNTETYTSTGGAEILFWGIQIEQASYPTSYIPTQGSTVTRIADACSQTVPDGIIGQTEGTMYWEGKFQDAQNPILMQIVPSSANYLSSIYIEFNKALNSIRFNIFDSGVIQTTLTTSATPETKYKIALAYKQNDIQGYVNGVSIGSDTNATIQSGLNNLLIGGLVGYVNNNTFIGTKPNNVRLYNTRLSNSELATLTSL